MKRVVPAAIEAIRQRRRSAAFGGRSRGPDGVVTGTSFDRVPPPKRASRAPVTPVTMPE